MEIGGNPGVSMLFLIHIARARGLGRCVGTPDSSARGREGSAAGSRRTSCRLEPRVWVRKRMERARDPCENEAVFREIEWFSSVFLELLELRGHQDLLERQLLAELLVGTALPRHPEPHEVKCLAPSHTKSSVSLISTSRCSYSIRAHHAGL